MATLAALVQALPQELYDEVYRLTFTVISAEDIEINEDYEGPPSILQVNKASRALTVASYYSTNSFFAMRRLYLDSWLLSLDVQSLSVLREVRWLRFPSFTGFEGYCGMGMRMPLRIGYSGAVHWFRIWQWTPEDKPWEWYDPVALRETTCVCCFPVLNNQSISG